MTYRLRSKETLRRVAYHGRLPFACPLACDVTDAAGVTHRAARYVVEGRLCQLGRDGVLRVVANEERRAA